MPNQGNSGYIPTHPGSNTNTPIGNVSAGALPVDNWLKPPGGYPVDPNPDIPVDPNTISLLDPNSMGTDEEDLEDPNDVYNNLVLTPALKRKREDEFNLMKEAYSTIRGDSWETAMGYDTVGQKQLQAFKDRWEKILEDNEYEDYTDYSDMSSSYGGYASQNFNSGYNSLINPNQQSNKSGYIGG